MIPLRDNTRSRTFPVIVYGIIVVCVGVFIYTLRLDTEVAQRSFFATYGAVPASVTAGPWPEAWRGLVTSTFMHGSWMHLGGNMLYLWIFGDNVEDAMGHLRFLAFYLVAGIVAALAHIAAHPASAFPLVGASGAIAGVLGAYLILYPRARILSLLVLGIFIRLVDLPAILVLAFWFLLQLLEGIGALRNPDVTTVAWWAHVGGFATGAVLVLVFARRRRSAFQF